MFVLFASCSPVRRHAVPAPCPAPIFCCRRSCSMSRASHAPTRWEPDGGRAVQCPNGHNCTPCDAHASYLETHNSRAHALLAGHHYTSPHAREPRGSHACAPLTSHGCAPAASSARAPCPLAARHAAVALTPHSPAMVVPSHNLRTRHGEATNSSPYHASCYRRTSHWAGRHFPAPRARSEREIFARRLPLHSSHPPPGLGDGSKLAVSRKTRGNESS